MGAAVVVRIPDIPAKIRKIPQAKHEGDYSVEYTAKRWYDKEAGQSRNEKYIIGTILAEYPKAMLPNETYYRFFDGETGRLLQSEESGEEQEESADGTAGESAAGNAGERTGGDTKESTEGNTKKSISGEAEKTTRKTDASSGSQSDAQAGKPSGPEKAGDDSDTPDFRLFLESLNRTRELFAEAEQREKDRQEREKRKKKVAELYGEGYADEQEIREATESLMKLFTDVQPSEKTGSEQNKEEKQAGNEQNHEEKQAGNEQHNGGKQTGNEENKEEERTLAEAYTDYQQSRERAAILYHILDEICDSIKIQAKKRPDAIVNAYKIIRINTILAYKCHVRKAEQKGRTGEEVDQVIKWLTGYVSIDILKGLNCGQFLSLAPMWNPRSELITGPVCGTKVEETDDPMTKRMRQLDQLIDELTEGKPMEKVLR